MAIVTTAQAGDWSNNATWTGGALPGTADTAEINHNVELDQADQITILDIDGGELRFEASFDITFTDSAGCGVVIRDTAGSGLTHSSTAPPTKSAICEFKSATAQSPTNPWTWTVENVSGEDTRNINLDFVEFTGCKWYLGNDNFEIDFNGGGATDPLITSITPFAPNPNVVEHTVQGRKYGRNYPRGGSSGVMTVTGRFHQDSWDTITIKQMIRDESRLFFASRFHHLPKCRIVAEPRYAERGAWIDFTLIIKEDE